jgi:hypothetical protein
MGECARRGMYGERNMKKGRRKKGRSNRKRRRK